MGITVTDYLYTALFTKKSIELQKKNLLKEESVYSDPILLEVSSTHKSHKNRMIIPLLELET